MWGDNLILLVASAVPEVVDKIPIAIPAPSGVGGTLAYIASGVALISGTLYLLWRRVKSDSRDDKSSDLQSNVFAQLTASIDSLKALLETERQYSAQLARQTNDLLAEMTKQRREWDDERRLLIRDVDEANRKVEALNSELDRMTEQVRVLSDKLSLLQGEQSPPPPSPPSVQ